MCGPRLIRRNQEEGQPATDRAETLTFPFYLFFDLLSSISSSSVLQSGADAAVGKCTQRMSKESMFMSSNVRLSFLVMRLGERGRKHTSKSAVDSRDDDEKVISLWLPFQFGSSSLGYLSLLLSSLLTVQIPKYKYKMSVFSFCSIELPPFLEPESSR